MLGRRINSFAVVGLFFLNNAYRIRNRLPWLIHFHLGKHNYRERPSFSSYAEKSNLPKKISMMLWMQHDLIMFTWDDIDSVSFLPLSHIDSVSFLPLVTFYDRKCTYPLLFYFTFPSTSHHHLACFSHLPGSSSLVQMFLMLHIFLPIELISIVKSNYFGNIGKSAFPELLSINVPSNFLGSSLNLKGYSLIKAKAGKLNSRLVS